MLQIITNSPYKMFKSLVLATVALAAQAYAAKQPFIKMADTKQCLPGDTDCNNGYCCPAPYIFCCADNMNCAPTEANCPFVDTKKQFIQMAAKKECSPEEADCNGWCCSGDFPACCFNVPYMCACFEAACPAFDAKTQFTEMAAKKQFIKMTSKKQCEGTTCPAGCCPYENWFCCSDNMNCAITEDNCPFVDVRKQLTKMAAENRL